MKKQKYILGHLKDIRVKIMKKLSGEGYNNSEIGSIFYLDRSCVQRILKKQNK